LNRYMFELRARACAVVPWRRHSRGKSRVETNELAEC
jgi:hypothetical protein